MRLTMIAAITALTISAFGQTKEVAAKPEAPVIATKVEAAPAINTAKLWRLLSRAQGLRQQLNESPQGKEVAAAEADLQAEQAKLQAACGASFALGFQTDQKADNAGDLICVKKPAEPVPTVKKEK